MGAFRTLLLFLGPLAVAAVLAILYILRVPKYAPFKLSSPVPKALLENSYAASDSKSFWKPQVDTTRSIGLKKPPITARSALSYDLTTDKLLYEKDIHAKLPIASLTKIMTAIVALENMNITKEISISDYAATIGEDSMGIAASERFTLQELLYGLFLHSGNDAAEAIVQASPVGRDNFIFLMNKKAEYMGLTDTHFTNPTGLEGDGKQYSTVVDLLVMTQYGLANPYFAQIAATPHYVIPQTSYHKEYDLYNETNLLTSYPGVKGVKTGYTDEAGMCLITYLEYGGHRIIAILLHSDNRRQEMKELLDYSLKTLGVKPPPHG